MSAMVCMHTMQGARESQDCNCSTVSRTHNSSQCEFSNDDFFQTYNGSSRFFFPFCLAFGLTASALFAELWLQQGNTKRQRVQQMEQHNNDQQQEVPINTNTTTRHQKGDVLGSLTSSCLLGLSSFVFMIIYEYYEKKEESDRANLIFQLYMISAMILLCLVGLISLHCNEVSGGGISLDEFLMFLSFFGVNVIAVQQTIGVSGNLRESSVSVESQWKAQTQLAEGVLSSVQAALQAAFVTKSLHRKPRNIRIVNTANLAVIVLFCNMGMWLVDSIYLVDIGLGYQGTYPYNDLDGNVLTAFRPRESMWVHVIFYPLVVFFRIHCVFVLCRVFHRHRRLDVDNETAIR